MLSAFTARPLVELKQRDKSKVESVLAYGDLLLVGLNSGSLRSYRVNDNSEEEDHGDNDDQRPRSAKKPVDLLREQEKFSKYKIEQLALVKEADTLVSLSNGYVHLHDLNKYTLKETLARSKGATTFAIVSDLVKDAATDVHSVVTKLAVAVKRRLLVWTWHDGELANDIFEHTLVTGIKSLTWDTNSKIVVGLGASYVIVNIDTSTVTDIVGPGSIGGAPGQDGGRLGATGVASMGYLGMSAPKPLATKLGQSEMLLARDINTHFIDPDGNSLGRRQIPWPVAPEAVAYSHPYLLALQAGKGMLEVRNPHTLTLLQTTSLQSANRFHMPQPESRLTFTGNGFFVLSERAVWWMQSENYGGQIDQLVERGAFDEAISLIGMLDEDSLKDKDTRMRNVKMQKAQILFEEHKYRDSIDLFTEVDAPPERVISFYPPIIAGDASAYPEEKHESRSLLTLSPKSSKSRRESIKKDSSDEATSSSAETSQKANDEVPKPSVPEKALEGKDLKAATEELRGFLVQARTRMKNVLNSDGTVKRESLGDVASTNLSSLLTRVTSNQSQDQENLLSTAKLIDTTLFRAYMLVSPGFVGPLFRIDNFCDPDVVNEKLTKAGRFNDLVDFLYGKKLHRQALELLERLGNRKEPSDEAPKLVGPQRTVSYLQALPPEQVDLILEYAKWPLRKDPEMGMEIFLADTENAETLPRDRVLSFLSSISSDLTLQYLEHIIEDLNDTTPTFHHQLAEIYIQRLKEKRPFTSPKDRADWESKTLSFLRSSKGYTPYKLLSQLPIPSSTKPATDNEATLEEARALVLSTMGQHKQALSIYVFNLASPDKAEEYCNTVYLSSLPANPTPTYHHPSAIDDADTSTHASIYHNLLSLYLSPPSPHKPNWPAALSLLAHHGARMPASSTLSLIPDTLNVKEMESYFLRQLRSQKTAANESQIVAGLRAAEAFREEGRLRLGDEFDLAYAGSVGGRGGVDGFTGSKGNNRGRNRRVLVEEDKVCGVCYRRFGGSAVKVMPDNSVVHYSCSVR